MKLQRSRLGLSRGDVEHTVLTPECNTKASVYRRPHCIPQIHFRNSCLLRTWPGAACRSAMRHLRRQSVSSFPHHAASTPIQYISIAGLLQHPRAPPLPNQIHRKLTALGASRSCCKFEKKTNAEAYALIHSRLLSHHLSASCQFRDSTTATSQTTPPVPLTPPTVIRSATKCHCAISTGDHPRRCGSF